MPVEYRVRFENGSMVISQSGDPIGSPKTGQTSGSPPVLTSNHLGASYDASAKGGGGNPDTGTGGGGNPDTGTGGGGNPDTGTGGGGNPDTGTGGTPPQALSPGQTYAAAHFQMETQQESEWCWAAVSASVDHYFKPSSHLRQCDIASQVILDDCCKNPDQFDEPEMLQDALDAVDRLAGITGRLSFEQVQSEIDARRPVCIRIEWDGGGAHFVALTGYQVLNSGARTIDVADPFYPDSTNDYDAFPSYYHGGGVWTATFFTKK